MKSLNLILLTASMAWTISCGASDEADTVYQDLIDQGWVFFSGAQYDSALSRFTSARDYNTELAEAYTGRGWSYVKLDNLSTAAGEFTIGSGSLDPTSDLYAGWAFTLNAQKSYALSNMQADQALTMDSNWVFSHGLALDHDHLHLLKAENHFALGDYTSSLNEVKILSPSFNADVATSDGQAQLANEIEQLKTTLL